MSDSECKSKKDRERSAEIVRAIGRRPPPEYGTKTFWRR